MQGAGGEAGVKALEVALRKGVKFIDLEITSGAQVTPPERPVPLSGGIKLEEVLQKIKKLAFIRSEYPLTISLDLTRCDIENQAIAAELFRDVFGASLLTEKLGDSERLPSPEQLKGKIILSAQDEELQEEVESLTEHVIGEVWFKYDEEDATEENTSKKGWKKRDMILRGDTLSFQAQTSEILKEMSKKPYFVGVMSKANIEAFLKEVAEKETINKKFLMYCYQDVFRVVVKNKKEKPDILHFEVNYNENSKKYNMDTDLDRERTFETVDDLIRFYQSDKCGGQGNKISHQTDLKDPLELQGTDIHKYSSWYKGNLDDERTRKIMADVNQKGSFLVREPEDAATYRQTFFIEYYDGNNPQQLKVEANMDESEVLIPGQG